MEWMGSQDLQDLYHDLDLEDLNYNLEDLKKDLEDLNYDLEDQRKGLEDLNNDL